MLCPQALSPQIHPKPQDCINTTPFRSIPAFLSREKELEALNAAPLSHDRSQRIDVAITGPAGVGKTELTLKFIEDNAARFDHVLWISSENETSIYNSFINIAHELKINEVPHSVSDFELLVKTIYKTLTPYNCLLIFDNVDIDIQICFPPMGVDRSKFFIVVTSQFTEWPCTLHLPLPCFSPEVSCQLLESRLGASEQTQLLAEQLGHLPLALQTAVLYIKHQRELKQFVHEEYTVEDFISELASSPEKFLNYEPANYGNYNKSLSVICDLAKGVIAKCNHGDLALKLLNIMSFLKPDQIEVSTLEYIIVDNAMNEALLLLKNYSLIENVEKIISMNPITQYVNQNSCNTKIMLTEILTAFNKEVLNRTFPFCFHSSVCIQTLYIWKFTCKFDDLVKKYCSLFLAAARDGGNNEKTLRNIEEQNKVLEKVCNWGNDDFKTHKMFQILILSRSGQAEKVLDACEKFFADAKPHALSHHYKMSVLHYKSCALFKLRRFEEAWELCEDVYNRRCDYNGRKNSNTLDSLQVLCRIACKLHEQGQKDKLQSLKPILEVIFDNEDWNSSPGMPKRAAERMDIVRETMNYCLESGEEEETLAFFTRLLTKLESKLESPHILIELATIEKSKCLLKLGEQKVAWDLVIALKDEDGYSAAVITVLCNMACMVQKKMKRKALQTCVDILKTYLTGDFVHQFEKTLKNIETLEESLHAAGKDADVLELYTRLHTVMLADYPKGDEPQVLRVLLYKALYLCDHERVDEAWQIYEYVCELSGCEPQQKPDDWEEVHAILSQFEAELLKEGAISPL